MFDGAAPQKLSRIRLLLKTRNLVSSSLHRYVSLDLLEQHGVGLDVVPTATQGPAERQPERNANS